MQNEPVYLTAIELAAALGCHPMTISNWGRKGCPRHRRRLRRYEYVMDEVLTWVQRQPGTERPLTAGLSFIAGREVTP